MREGQARVREHLIAARPYLFSFLIGGIGAIAFYLLKLPLPFFLGSLTVALIASVARFNVAMPRSFSVPVRCTLGVTIGTAFTPALLSALPGMLGSLALFVPYTAFLIFVGQVFFERVARFDRTTAFFSSMPGGLTDMVMMSAEAGGNQRAVTLIQSTRIVALVFMVPIWLQLQDGIKVGGAIVQAKHLWETSILDLAVLAALGWAGLRGAEALKLAGAPIVGPMIASALVHASGLSAAQMPFEVLTLAQIALGIMLGARFRGLTLSEFLTTMVWGLVYTVILLVLSVIAAMAVERLTGFDHVSVLLAYAPGGQTELNLLAFILGSDVAYVALHHLVRLAIVILGAQIVFARNRDWTKGRDGGM
jgi:hypothetical protein